MATKEKESKPKLNGDGLVGGSIVSPKEVQEINLKKRLKTK